MARQYVWNSNKEEFELVDVYEGVMAEFDRQDKQAAQQSVQRTGLYAACDFPGCEELGIIWVCANHATPSR